MCILFACCTLEVSILLHLMKTYLLDILNKYNRFSEKLDVKTILCNKAWLVFNDEGKKELYIFQEDGSLIASVNGNVTYANWQYIPANKSIIISYNKEQPLMLHPAFIDNTIFALQQDGTNRFAFMIEEKQSKCFNPKTLKELNAYFEGIRQKEIEAKEKRLRQIEQQRIEERWRIQQEREQQRQAEIERKEIELYRKADDIRYPNDFLAVYCIILIIIVVLLCVILPIPTFDIIEIFKAIGTIILIVGFLGYFLLLLIGKWKVKRWKKKHPDDPINDYF